MKKALKIVWIIFASIIWFLILVFALVWVTTAWIDDKANEIITQMQAWNIESMHSEIALIEQNNNIENGLTLEELTNAIILPSWQADLRTIKNVSWNERWFENEIKYIKWEGDLDNWLKIEIRLDFIETETWYLFYWINWQSK